MRTNQDLSPGLQAREALFTKLYQSCFPALARYVSKMGGSFEQAKDVFQDALLIYYEKSARGRLVLEKGEAPYIGGIARHLWLRRYKESSRTQQWKPSADVAQEEAGQPSSARILRYLETAGQKCMDLLRAFYYDNSSLEDIAAGFGFSGVRSATVQKFKCLEKVREKIREKSLSYEDFLNETQSIEEYLLGNKPEDKLLFEAQLLLQSGLHDTLAWQKQAYEAVNSYSRKKLKEEIEAVHRRLFTAPEHRGFRHKILSLFLKK